MKVWLGVLLLLLSLATRVRANSFVVINEVYPNPPGSSEDDEWVELFNQSGTEQTLGGWMLDDAEGGSKPYVLPVATISAHGFLVIEKSQSRIALNNSGDEVTLINPAGELANILTFPEISEGVAWGRFPDGGSDMRLMETPSKGMANIAKAAPSPTAPPTFLPSPTMANPTEFHLSEVFPCPDKDGQEWVELFSAQTSGSIEGWKIRNGRDKERSLNGAFSNYPVVRFGNHGFSNQGDTLALVSPAGATADEMSYQSCADNTSWSWSGDKWSETVIQTPGKVNVILSPVAIESRKAPTPMPTSEKTMVIASPTGERSMATASGNQSLKHGEVLSTTTSGIYGLYEITPTKATLTGQTPPTPAKSGAAYPTVAGCFFIAASVFGAVWKHYRKPRSLPLF